MERLTHERLNGIRDGYWSPNKKQELVDRLAAYENTDLDPEQVKHVKETAKKYLLEKAQGKVGGWIPVEERLPEDGKTVLCTDGEYIYLVEYDADLDAPFGDMDGITHWQPSPEPYRPERSEGE